MNLAQEAQKQKEARATTTMCRVFALHAAPEVIHEHRDRSKPWVLLDFSLHQGIRKKKKEKIRKTYKLNTIKMKKI